MCPADHDEHRKSFATLGMSSKKSLQALSRPIPTNEECVQRCTYDPAISVPSGGYSATAHAADLYDPRRRVPVAR